MPSFQASLTERVIYLDSPISDDSARLVMESLLFFDVHQRGQLMITRELEPRGVECPRRG